MGNYGIIQPDGASTGARLNLERRFELMRRHIDLHDKHILDMGCGDGRYVSKFLEYSQHVRGIDINEQAVNSYRKSAQNPGLVLLGDLQALPFKENRFDIVLLNEVLEHVPDDRLAVREAWRVLKPGAWLVVFSPNRLYPFETHGVRISKSGQNLPYYFPFIPYIPLSIGHKFLTYNARNYIPRELRQLIKIQPFEISAQTFIWQTFENISGSSPRLLVTLSPILRKISFAMEKLPGIRNFGVSQVIIAKKNS